MTNDLADKVRACSEDGSHPEKQQWLSRTYCTLSMGENNPREHDCPYLRKEEVDLGHTPQQVSLKGYGCNAALPPKF